MLIAKWNTEADEKAACTCIEPVETIVRSPLATFFQRLAHRISRAIVDDVPPDLDACETCREIECTQSHWEGCEQRLQKIRLRLQNRE